MIAPKLTIADIERKPEFSGLLREDSAFARGDADGVGESVNGWYDSLMLQSGIKTPPGLWLGVCLLCSLATGGTAWVVSERELVAAFFGMVGLVLPIGYAIFARARRQKTIMSQLPSMAEELARFARSGRNLENALMMVAADTPSPLGDELKTCTRRMEMGLGVGNAVQDLAGRTGVSTLTLFSSALSLNQDTGGDLIQVLERLANSVRDRLHFISRQRAATITSRMGVAMMVIVPILVLGFFTVRDPDYLDKLVGSFWGRLSLWLAVILQIIGCLMVFRILSRSARF